MTFSISLWTRVKTMIFPRPTIESIFKMSNAQILKCFHQCSVSFRPTMYLKHNEHEDSSLSEPLNNKVIQFEICNLILSQFQSNISKFYNLEISPFIIRLIRFCLKIFSICVLRKKTADANIIVITMQYLKTGMLCRIGKLQRLDQHMPKYQK